uniref:Uncharacterized protein MANES_14G014600 n=1 Tax=Rhizophora mucronata TaxID=61149 RepID=A0A2P2K1I0_RHIMU
MLRLAKTKLYWWGFRNGAIFGSTQPASCSCCCCEIVQGTISGYSKGTDRDHISDKLVCATF